jgi:hypothetical protein
MGADSVYAWQMLLGLHYSILGRLVVYLVTDLLTAEFVK